MSTTSKIKITNSQTVYKVSALLIFLASIVLGVLVPIIAIPWMFLLAYFGFTNKKAPKESFSWLLGRTAMAAALVLGVIIFIVLAFLMVWSSKPMI